MDAANGSNWRGGTSRGPRPLFTGLGVTLVLVGIIAVPFAWLLSSPGVRVAGQLYDQGKPDVSQAIYYAGSGGDRLTVRLARTMTRDEAQRFRCEKVVPLLTAKGLTARVVIEHPGGSFVFDKEPCP